MIICSGPRCQTTAGCRCDVRPITGCQICTGECRCLFRAADDGPVVIVVTQPYVPSFLPPFFSSRRDDPAEQHHPRSPRASFRKRSGRAA